jgi:DNA invertase Pin-like site-specific DNA recombinase
MKKASSPPIPAAAYARCSLREQVEKGLSIPAQIEEIHRWSKEHGYEIVAEFVDAGRRGSDDTREEFVRLRKLSSERKCPWKAIIIWKSDRMARDTEQAAVFRGILRRNGIDLLSVTEPNLEGPIGALMSAVLDAIAAFYSGQLAENVLRGQKQGARAGFVQGGIAPFGLKKIAIENEYGKTKWKYAPDPATAPWVRWIYDRYGEGAAMIDIVKELNKRAVPTLRGGRWQTSLISKILNRHQQTYLGSLVYNRVRLPKGAVTQIPKAPDEWVVTPGAHDPIITMEQAERVNLARQGRPSLTANRQNATPTLLDGLVFCGVCKRRLTIGSGRWLKAGSEVTEPYYHCSPKSFARLKGIETEESAHPGYFVPVNVLAPIVTEKVRAKVLADGFVESLQDHIARLETVHKKNTQKQLVVLEKETEKIKARRNALAEAVLDGSIPRDVARGKQQEMTLALGELEKQLDQLSVPVPPSPLLRLSELPPEAFCEALKTPNGLRAVMVSLIEKIETWPDRHGTIFYSELFPPEEIRFPRRPRGRQALKA